MMKMKGGYGNNGDKLSIGMCSQYPAKAGAKTKAALSKRVGSTGGSLGNTWQGNISKHANVKGGTAAGSA